jgi:RHS repeat-associated protein
VWNSSTLQPFNFSTSYYTHDGNKNVSEVMAANGDTSAHYEYDPVGAVTAQRGGLCDTNIWRFSSEYADDEAATLYYNYRNYVSTVGRWASRDPENEYYGKLDYLILSNDTIDTFDALGLKKMNPRTTASVCQKYINVREDMKSYDTHKADPDSLIDKEKSVCKKKIDTARRSDPMKKVLSLFGDSCKVPEIECKCCDWYTKKDGSDAASISGIYSRDTRKITYCWNNHKRKRWTDSYMRKTLAHELTHALQHCAGYGTNCKESIKKEIEARICAKECSTFDDCLESALASSCIALHCITGAEAMNAYQEVKEWYDAKRTKGHYKPGGFCYFGK